MRFRSTPVLAAAAVGLLVLSGCSSDEPTAGDEPTAAGGATSDGSDEPDTDDSEIPSDLPTELPTDVDDLDVELGECDDLYQALLDATNATQDALTDPSTANEVFAAVSQALRDASADADPEIAAAAEDLATQYDEFGAAIAGGDPAALEGLDINAMTEASTALQEACLG